MEELATTGTLHRFVPNVKFSRLQRSLKKIHSEELDSELDTASLWSERAIFRRKMPSERPGLRASHTSLWSERAIFQRKMPSERPGLWN